MSREVVDKAMEESSHFTEQCLAAKLRYKSDLIESWLEIAKTDFATLKIVVDHYPVINNIAKCDVHPKHEKATELEHIAWFKKNFGVSIEDLQAFLPYILELINNSKKSKNNEGKEK